MSDVIKESEANKPSWWPRRNPKSLIEQGELDQWLDSLARGPEPLEYRIQKGTRHIFCAMCRERVSLIQVGVFGNRLMVPICDLCVMHSWTEQWAEDVVRERLHDEPTFWQKPEEVAS